MLIGVWISQLEQAEKDFLEDMMKVLTFDCFTIIQAY
jgi:hypothetical protein